VVPFYSPFNPSDWSPFASPPPLEEVFRDVVKVIPSGFRHPEATKARIYFDGKRFVTRDFNETERKLSGDIVADGVRCGCVEVFHLEEPTERDQFSFLREEGALVEWITSALGSAVERKRTEKTLRKSEAKFRTLVEHLPVITYTAALNETSKTLYVSPQIGKVLGLSPEQCAVNPGFWAEYLHDEDRARVLGEIHRSHQSGEPFISEYRMVPPAGRPVWFRDEARIVKGEDGGPLYLLGVMQDITERKQAQKKLERAMKDIKRSNRDLEQFAYVAAHDLQEPLRMVSSYTQLLAKRYEDALDKDANDFIHYTVDGCNRMRGLLESLLTLSRVGRRGKPFARTECRDVLASALKNLEVVIGENDATITYDELPAIMADEGQIVQLFQNLIANAIRYRGEAAPEVQVSAERRNGGWEFSVRDNGIGIDPEHYERIFEMFQRLHGRGAYPGTGMGLAVCKQIVERHGGNIGVESEPGKGSTFRFAIPAASDNSGSTRPTA